MAKKQSFGDKVLRQRASAKKMAKIMVAERKPNGEFRFKTKMVDIDTVKEEIQQARG